MNFTPRQTSNTWRDSLQEKYGNPETTNYEYEEWRYGVKTMLQCFQAEVEEHRRMVHLEYERDYQLMLRISKNQISEKERNKENLAENNQKKETSKKRKFET